MDSVSKAIHVLWLCLVVTPGITVLASQITPENAVRKVGDDISFECQSPKGYNEKYQEIWFTVKHDGKPIHEPKSPDRAKEDYAVFGFSIIDLTTQDAGIYTCDITTQTDDKNVSASTNLFVLEDVKTTEFVKKDNPFDLSCLVADDSGFTTVIAWFADQVPVSHDKSKRMYVAGDSLHFKKASIDDAFRDIRCVVTSEECFNEYGSVRSALKNGTAAELNRTISVISIAYCSRLPCHLEVHVHGVTPVHISWMLGNVSISSVLDRKENVTTSRTGVFNTTALISLIVSGGQNMWSENITVGSHSSEQSKLSGKAIAGIVTGVLVLVVAIGIAAVIVCMRKCRNNNEEPKTTEEEMKELNQNGN